MSKNASLIQAIYLMCGMSCLARALNPTNQKDQIGEMNQKD